MALMSDYRKRQIRDTELRLYVIIILVASAVNLVGDWAGQRLSQVGKTL